MGVISNSEIAIKYKVSKPAVTYWIRDAVEKKNGLIVIENNTKFKVVDNPHNHNELLRLSEEGRKFRRNSLHADIIPTSEFYTTFSESEIVEIVRDLEVYKEINYKFTYKNGGAKYWDNFYNTGFRNQTYKPPIRVKNLLKNSFELILKRIPENIKVNVIEIGPGNSDPVKEFLKELNLLNLLNKYVAVDISSEMIDISRKNLQSWLPDIKFGSYICDIENTKLLNIFAKERVENPKTINFILDVGSTIGNHRNRLEVLRNIGEGLRQDDLFILSNATDLTNNKSAFSHLKTQEALNQDTWIPNILGFEITNCEITHKYDAEKNCKFESIYLDKDYTLTVRELNHDKVLKFHKGEEIVIWRHFMTNPETLFVELSQCGLKLVLFSTEKDFSHALMVCELKPMS